MLRLTIIISVIMFVAACGGSDGSDGLNTRAANTLVENDFNVMGGDIPAEEIESSLEDKSAFFNDGLSRELLVDEFNGIGEDPCLPAGRLISLLNEEIEISFDLVNVASCESDLSTLFSDFNVSAYYDNMTLLDASGNAVTVNSLNDLLSTELSSISFRVRATAGIAGAIDFFGTEIKINSELYMTMHGTGSFNTACTISNDVIDQCTMRVLTISVYEAESVEAGPVTDNITESFTAEYNNVQELAAAPYFASGTIDFVLNNWSGTVTYSGGFSQPSYTATNGIETVTGTLYNWDY